MKTCLFFCFEVKPIYNPRGSGDFNQNVIKWSPDHKVGEETPSGTGLGSLQMCCSCTRPGLLSLAIWNLWLLLYSWYSDLDDRIECSGGSCSSQLGGSWEMITDPRNELAQ